MFHGSNQREKSLGINIVGIERMRKIYTEKRNSFQGIKLAVGKISRTKKETKLGVEISICR